MTALTQYQRLEAPGLWRPDPQAQRLNVVVSIGDATLTISDTSDRALAHWSLAALHRLNPGDTPARYAPSEATEEIEELEIDDAEMLAALEKVRRAIELNRPRAGRLRLVLTLATIALAATLAVTWLPGALRQHTLSVLPDVTRAAVGNRLMERVRRVTGTPCAVPHGVAALDRLGARVFDGDRARLYVVPAGVNGARHLPGRIILIDLALVEDYPEPDVAAGFLLAEAERARVRDPMAALLEHAGIVATAKLLTTGEIEDSVLDAYAEALLLAPPAPLSDEALLARFEAAGVRSTPYAYALDPTGEATLGLIEADPVPLARSAPLLADADWVSLQGICAN